MCSFLPYIYSFLINTCAFITNICVFHFFYYQNLCFSGDHLWDHLSLFCTQCETEQRASCHLLGNTDTHLWTSFHEVCSDLIYSTQSNGSSGIIRRIFVLSGVSFRFVKIHVVLLPIPVIFKLISEIINNTYDILTNTWHFLTKTGGFRGCGSRQCCAVWLRVFAITQSNRCS